MNERLNDLLLEINSRSVSLLEHSAVLSSDVGGPRLVRPRCGRDCHRAVCASKCAGPRSTINRAKLGRFELVSSPVMYYVVPLLGMIAAILVLVVVYYRALGVIRG